ncbi:MAG: hypothetical protein ABH816_02695 [Candidatus Levyibacteriota bacterium]
MKNRTLIIAAVVVLLIIIGGGVYFLSSKNSTGKPQDLISEMSQEVIPTVMPSDIGLIITLRDDSKAMKFEITQIDGISLVEYQISYMKEVNGEQVPEGLIGEIKVKPGDKKITTDYREFGTCSSGKCRYDKVVSPVSLTLKITKDDGSILSSEEITQL